MNERSRQEGEFWKLLALDIKKLGSLIKDQECAIKELKNITALIDGYFLTSLNRRRSSDADINDEIKETLLTGGIQWKQSQSQSQSQV